MAVVTHKDDGLFPKPKEIKLSCSCPDYAGLCKHLAAVLYGIGARLDSRPELLFKLCGVDHNELISAVDPAIVFGSAAKGSSRRRTLDSSALGDVFGIDLETDRPPSIPEVKPKRADQAKKVAKKVVAKKVRASKNRDV